MSLSTKTWLLSLAMIFFAGIAAGWWYRGISLPATRSSVMQIAAPDDPPAIASAVQPFQTIATERAKREVDDRQVLSQMLSAQRYREATAYYYQRIQADAASKPRLRPTVETYFQRCFESCDAGAFLDLVDAWLATFYDDIPVLIRLAEFEERQGQPEAAANTLLLAKTYAFPVDEQLAVQQARDRLTRRTDKYLEDEQRWIELLGYYEFLAAIDFTTPEFELRRALLYQQRGERSRATQLLASLQKENDGNNPQLRAAIDSYLDQETAVRKTGSDPIEDISNSVPLEEYGSGFVVRVTLNDRDALKLMLDTGASVTALTPDSFRRLYRPDLSLLGTQLFKTASGYTRGDIYRASALVVGKERINNTNLAVLDELEINGVDGLLGMNVLRHFRFEIDRSAGVMYLERR